MKKPFVCQNCKTELGSRVGDDLYAGLFQLTFKRGHKIRCSNCGKDTTFPVAPRDKVIDKDVKVAKI